MARKKKTLDPNRPKFFGKYLEHRDQLKRLEQKKDRLTPMEYERQKMLIEIDYQEYLDAHENDWFGWDGPVYVGRGGKKEA